ncbi:MAG TPA: DUF6714 family protein [Kofleriaceae bacterium]|nr:DUF6714 family protein [Kofleriaceae bacterium]
MKPEHGRIDDQLRAAFPRVPIDMTRAFVPYGATYFEVEPFTAAVAGKPWDELDRSYLATRWDALGFLNPAALAAVLPAYLVEMLDHPYSNLPGMVASVLTRPSKARKGLGMARFTALVEALDESQRIAVASALQQFALEHADESAVREALDSFWDGFLSL